MYDIYLHVKKMRLKSPDVFLTLVLKHFELFSLPCFMPFVFCGIVPVIVCQLLKHFCMFLHSK